MAKNRPLTFEQRAAQQRAAAQSRDIDNLLGEIRDEFANDALEAQQVKEGRVFGTYDEAELKDRALTKSRAQQVLQNLKHEQEFVDAGLPKNRLPGTEQRMDQVLSRLKSDNGEIPGPFIFKNGEGNQVRMYTEEYKSPLTGEKEIKPFYNPETRKPLSTTFGDGRIHNIPGVEPDERWQDPVPNKFKNYNGRTPKGVINGAQVGPRGSELITKHTAWLSGQTDLRDAAKVDIEDFQNARSLNEVRDLSEQIQDVDYVDSRGKRIDAEVITDVQRNDGIDGAAQLRTKVKTHDNLGKGGVQAEIRHRMKANGETFDQAMTALQGDFSDRRALFAPPGGYDGGKIDKYDSAIHLTFEPKINADSTRKSQPAYLRDKVTIPPRAATTTDYSVAKDHIDKGEIRSTWNGGRDYNPDDSFKIDLKMDKNHPAVTDISGKGQVPQIMENPEVVRQRVPSTWDKDEAALAKVRAQSATSAVEPVAPTPPKAVSSVAQPIESPRPTPPAQRPVNRILEPPRPTRKPTQPPSRGQNAALQRPKGPPKGERGFIATPGRVRAKSVVKPRVGGAGGKLLKGGLVADIAIDGGLSYLTGETDNIGEAAYKGATSLIPDSGVTAKTMLIDDKVYTHDESTNMVYDHTGKVQGLAYKDGKPVAVPYGSLEGRTSMVDDVVNPLKQIGTAIRDTAVRRVSSFLNR